MTDMANYRLQNRKGTWYYYRKVPVHLIPTFGAVFIKKSLKTKSKAEAQKLRALKDIEYDALFASCDDGKVSAQGSIVVTFDQMVGYIRKYVAYDDARSAKEWQSDPPTNDEQLKDILAEAETRIEVLTGPADEERDLLVRSCFKLITKHEGLGDATLDNSAADLVRRGLIELYLRRLDRLYAKHDKEWHDSLFGPSAPAAVTFGSHAKTYLAEKEGEWKVANAGESWRKKVRACVSTLVSIVGADTFLKDVDDSRAKSVRVTLSLLPTNRVKLFADMSIEEAIEQAEIKKLRRLDATTQGVYLSTFSSILDLAQRRGLLAFNFAAGLKPLTKPLPAEQRRKPFSDEQIVQFFTGAFYKSCSAASDQPYVRENRDWRFWIPLLMAFNGGRPNEIAQLTADDVRQTKAGTWYIDLLSDDHDTDDAKPHIGVKNESSRRRIPVHTLMKQLGFIAFADKRRGAGGGAARLFPTLTPNTLGNYAHKASRSFNERWLKQDIMLDKRQTLYSFRHSCREALRRAGAGPEALGVIGGWSDGKKPVSSNYGDPNNPDHYIEWVNKIEYEGLDLTFLYVASKGTSHA